MRIRKFIDRDEELAMLEGQFSKDGFKFYPLYGRRRIGKTALLKEFVTKHDGIYYLCTGVGLEKNLRYLSRIISEHLGFPPIQVEDFRTLFAHLKAMGFNKSIIVLDEFPELIKSNEAILGEFQFIVDEILADTNCMLILCGSSVGMMENYVLSQKSPLFGRRTGQLMLGPIRQKDIHHFLPRFSFQKTIEIQSIVGGIPRYLMEFSDSSKVEPILKTAFFSNDGYLYREGYLLLRDELREPDTYMNILEALAAGKNRVTEMANAAYLAAKDMSKYLNVLQRLGIVERIQPVGAGPRSKKSIYVIRDPYFRFWFRFVFPHRGAIEFMQPEIPIEDYMTHKAEYISLFWERFILDLLQMRFGAKYQRIGRWWHKGNEVDIVGIGKKDILVGEVKWTTKKVGWKVVERLLEKAELVLSHGYEQHKRSFLVVSKSGFTKHSLERMDGDGIRIMHWSLSDVETMVVG